MVDADDIELTDESLVNEVLINLGPVQSSNLAVVNTDKEFLGIKPSFLHCVFQICHRPISLARVARKDEAVTIDEGVDGQAEDFRSMCC